MLEPLSLYTRQLATGEWFNTPPDDLIEAIARSNTVIFEKGHPGHGMMAVVRGRVKIRAPSPGGKEVVLNVIEPGDVFGEIALLDGKERSADAVAMRAAG